MRNPAADRCDAQPPTIEVPADTADRPMDDFQTFDFEAEIAPGKAVSHRVYVKGERRRPGVLLMHELPGLTWQCARLARLVEESGFRVYVPLLFGDANVDGSSKVHSATSFARLCVSREFRLLARNRSSPITNWLRALGGRIRGECRGSGLGAIGMCLTGSFALSLLLDSPRVAPVVCQPALPFRPSPARALGLADADLVSIKRRVADDAIPIRAYRFEGDTICPAARLDRMEEEFPTLLRWDLKGDRHATLTQALEQGTETACALEDVLRYLHQRID
jgi:dienelactone hydrolase